jgi:hypothetical protein
MGAGNAGSNKGGSSDAPLTTRSTVTPKKSVTTRVIDSGKNLITARRKTAYNVSKVIPGSEKRLRKNRTDYRNYLTSKGSTPDFLKDDKNLTSFETYDKLINYKPTQRNPNEKVALNYADYLAEEKGNYNLKMAGNVGSINNPERGRDNEVANTIIKKNVGGKTVQTTEAKIEEEKKEYDARQTKKKGRNQNILTSKRGVMKTSADYSLGKKSLLGQVV